VLLRGGGAGRSIFRKGADFTAAMAFQFASTNLVVELGILLAVLLGWQFTLAEFVGGPLMIVGLALVFRATLRRGLCGCRASGCTCDHGSGSRCRRGACRQLLTT
jgi:uncharacterized membrane protein YraQ (UPF0718 family)